MAQGRFAAGFGGYAGKAFQMEVNDPAFVGGEVPQNDFLVQRERFFCGGLR